MFFLRKHRFTVYIQIECRFLNYYPVFVYRNPLYVKKLLTLIAPRNFFFLYLKSLFPTCKLLSSKNRSKLKFKIQRPELALRTKLVPLLEFRLL